MPFHLMMMIHKRIEAAVVSVFLSHDAMLVYDFYVCTEMNEGNEL